VAAKGAEVLLEAWPERRAEATLVVVGDGPFAGRFRALPGTRMLGPLPREQLPVAYAATRFTVVPSVPTARFREPWGLVCNEAMPQAFDRALGAAGALSEPAR